MLHLRILAAIYILFIRSHWPLLCGIREVIGAGSDPIDRCIACALLCEISGIGIKKGQGESGS